MLQCWYISSAILYCVSRLHPMEEKGSFLSFRFFLLFLYLNDEDKDHYDDNDNNSYFNPLGSSSFLLISLFFYYFLLTFFLSFLFPSLFSFFPFSLLSASLSLYWALWFVRIAIICATWGRTLAREHWRWEFLPLSRYKVGEVKKMVVWVYLFKSRFCVIISHSWKGLRS